jgi:hypothetical protein
MRPKPSITVEQFGHVLPNDWPFVVPCKFILSGPVVERGYWHAANPGKAPWFRTEGAARKALAKLYRLHAHEVTADQAEADHVSAWQRRVRRRAEMQLALLMDKYPNPARS